MCTHTSSNTNHDKAWGPFIIWNLSKTRCSFRKWAVLRVFLFQALLKIRGSRTELGSFEYLCWALTDSPYLWILPENNSFVFLSGTCKDTYPSNRWGPDMKWIPAGRHFNELICIGPISLCTAVIITRACTFMRWKSGHPIAQFW